MRISRFWTSGRTRAPPRVGLSCSCWRAPRAACPDLRASAGRPPAAPARAFELVAVVPHVHVHRRPPRARRASRTRGTRATPRSPRNTTRSSAPRGRVLHPTSYWSEKKYGDSVVGRGPGRACSAPPPGPCSSAFAQCSTRSGSPMDRMLRAARCRPRRRRSGRSSQAVVDEHAVVDLEAGRRRSSMRGAAPTPITTRSRRASPPASHAGRRARRPRSPRRRCRAPARRRGRRAVAVDAAELRPEHALERHLVRRRRSSPRRRAAAPTRRPRSRSSPRRRRPPARPARSARAACRSRASVRR